MNKQDTIKRNLYMLFWKYPYLKNKNYNYLYFKYVKEFHKDDLFNLQFDYELKSNPFSPEYWENMPAMESISRCKRKLALKDELNRADSKKVI
jgi:hypothetical protein